MRFKRQKLALVAGLFLVGCGVTVQAPQTPTGGGGGVLVEAPMAPEAEAQFRALDVDPARDILERLAAELNITVIVNQETTVVNTVTPVVVLPTNAEKVCGVSQKEENHQADCGTWTVSASSTRNAWFAVSNTQDTNLRTAWAPAESDTQPTLTLKADTAMDLSAMTLKMSPQGVVVDIDVWVDGQWKRLVTGLVPEYRTLDWINLPQATTDQVRLSFRGPQAAQALICHVDLFGPHCGPSPKPSATPSAAVTASPSAAPSVVPSASPGVEPSASPSVAPTASPSASPSVEPTASPTATPSTEPEPSPTAEPTATPSAEVSPSAEPSPSNLAPTT